ncbi:MAG: chorismate-binding protein [Bacteroidetes bacterium]|nr:chorismate-binding protein [Bacteroidota bacterium]
MSKNKTILSFNDYCRRRISLKKSFVFYRLPHSNEIQGIEAEASFTLKNFDPELKGFLFHPFDAKKQIVEFIPGAAQNFVIENGASSEKLNLNEISSEKPSFISSEEDYKAQFEHYQQAFSKGEIKKAILSRIKFIEAEKIDIHTTFLNLVKSYPEAYIYCYYSITAGLWIGASPEKFLFLKDNTLETTALAGTKTEEESWGSKEQEEQAIVTQFIEDSLHDLQNVEVSEPETIKAGNLYHIKANIKAQFNANTDIPALINKLHPTPAVGGYPKEAALRLIASTEKHDRAYYSGFAGPVNINDNTHLFVNLRCAKVFKNGLGLFIGGGLTAASNLEKEWKETENKAGTLMKVIV